MHYFKKVSMFIMLPFIQSLVNGDKYVYTCIGFMILMSLMVRRRNLQLMYTQNTRIDMIRKSLASLYIMIDNVFMKSIFIYLGVNMLTKGIIRLLVFMFYDKHILISTCISVSTVFLYKYDHIFTPYNKLRRMITIYVCYILLVVYNLHGML